MGQLGKLRLKIEGEGGGMAIFSELKIADFPGLCVASLTFIHVSETLILQRVEYWLLSTLTHMYF